MKATFILIVLLLLLIPMPVYAYDIPGQGTDNATDVILWMGDNITIETANLTIDSGNLTVAGTVEITGLTESNEDIAGDFFSFLIVAFIIVLVLKIGGPVLNSLGVIISFIYGFTLASDQEPYTLLWVAGVSIGLFGLYLFFEIAKEPVSKVVSLVRGIFRK